MKAGKVSRKNETAYSRASFKKSTGHFLFGRLLNAAAGFSILLILASILPKQHYAQYVAAFALLELGLLIFGFGMEWITAIHIPRLRISENSNALSKFTLACASVHTVLYIVGSAVYFCVAPNLADILGMPDATWTFQLYAIVLAAEGIGRAVRDQLLGNLLEQGLAQTSQLIRNIAILAFAALAFTDSEFRTADKLAIAEIVASSLSLAFGVTFLLKVLRNSESTQNSISKWVPPQFSELVKVGLNAWISNLVALLSSSQVVVLIVARLAGAEFSAVFGFARNLGDQVRRYLPLEFLLGIARALLVSRYVDEGDSAKLVARSAIFYRANVVFLAPIFLVAILYGDIICGLLSNGKYQSAHWLFVGWLAVATFWSHRRIADTIAHALGRSDLSRRASLFLIATPVIAYHLIGEGLWVALFLLLAGAELLYSILVLSPMGSYSPNILALAKVLTAMVGSGAILTAIDSQYPISSPFALALKIVLAFALTIVLSYLLRAWSNFEEKIFRNR